MNKFVLKKSYVDLKTHIMEVKELIIELYKLDYKKQQV